MKLDQQNNSLEEIIAKEIGSFMNSEGGNLIIGVDDTNEILGLEKDYSTLKKQDSDGFALQLTNIVNTYLDKTLNSHIEISFPMVDGKEICLCKIKKSSNPVYLHSKNEKKFYVRMNNSSQPLDMEQAHRYIMEHWK
jgi:predicted HTH transcriptional regulator